VLRARLEKQVGGLLAWKMLIEAMDRYMLGDLTAEELAQGRVRTKTGWRIKPTLRTER
jgi:hypothetical protein